MASFVESSVLVFVLLNPFLLTVYLVDLIRDLDRKTFTRVLLRAGSISGATFVVFALAGDAVFSHVLQARFASFQVFGGVVFLVIGVRFALSGSTAVEVLRGSPQHLAGAIAMPFMIGPGTVGASIVAGGSNPPAAAVGAVLCAVVTTLLCVLAFKALHDRFLNGRERLVQRYVEITGRISALVIGTFAVETIMRGLAGWLPAVK